MDKEQRGGLNPPHFIPTKCFFKSSKSSKILIAVFSLCRGKPKTGLFSEIYGGMTMQRSRHVLDMDARSSCKKHLDPSGHCHHMIPIVLSKKSLPLYPNPFHPTYFSFTPRIEDESYRPTRINPLLPGLLVTFSILSVCLISDSTIYRIPEQSDTSTTLTLPFIEALRHSLNVNSSLPMPFCPKY